MPPNDRWADLKEEFAALSDQPSAEQHRYLTVLTERDPELARLLRELLEADARADSALERFDALPGATSAGIPNATDPFGYSGQTISDFHVREVLGAGGMGVVYRAEDARLGRSLALKFLLPQYAFDTVAKQRFLQEARAASTLDHPNVCTVYGVGETHSGAPFLAMAYYDGETLKERLSRSPIAPPEAISIVRQMLLALQASHAAGIIHRDLKPGNVMLARDASVKILDFGLAKVGDLSLTASGGHPGTIAYMSPEQVQGKPIDHRCDLWSLGVIMYEMLASERPFRGSHDISMVYSILHDEPRVPSRVRPDAPAAYDTIVQRLLAKNPAERYASATEVLSALDGVAVGGPARTPAVRRTRPDATRYAIGIALVGVLIVGGVVAAVRRDREPAQSDGSSAANVSGNADSSVDPRSVAVLPFTDMSATQDQAYLGDGVAEEILNALAHVPDLRVPARTSSFSFKGRNLQVREIARQLGVATVLEGSIRKDGDSIRITAQLIDARSDRHLWSQTFDRDVANAFAVQTEIARTVTEALQVRLANSAAPAPATSARAHDLYLQGRFHWNRRSPDDLRRAIRLFEDAIRADSGYARAWAGLANAYAVLPISSGSATVDGSLDKAVQAATMAIALDSTLAEAHVALGYAYHWQWRWTDAERSLHRATVLDPANTTAHQLYAEHLVKMGRGAEAEAEVRRAVVLDPLSPIANNQLGLVLFLSGRLDEAIAQLEQTSRMDPSIPAPQILLHRAYLLTGRIEESERAGRRFAELLGVPNATDYVTLARAARDSTARPASRAILERWERGPNPTWPEISLYWIVMGDRDRAVDALEKGLRARSPMMAGMKAAPWLGAVQSDPRVGRIIRSMRFP